MPPDHTVVHLVRHAQVHNPTGILYGRRPGYGLSELGRSMADTLAGFFAGQQIDALIVSPMQRARETAEPIADRLGLTMQTDERLNEATNQFEGQRWGLRDGILGRPANWPKLINPLRPSWGEPYVDIAVRMGMAVESARLQSRGGAVICVSHQLPIEVVRRALLGQRLWHDPRRRQCALASVTTLHFRGTELESIDYQQPCGDAAGVGA